ncbi:hypothetical protein GCM10011375_40330 [Hymenobacter qilianensis]|uniref:Uncharacterized protein n=2 Tax=Hymenobacter qilianensis TaxID=1385715 RepID=A0ACB5PX89_9BACT|nr:hypothetical protein [Hymenobacter qilianensis]QNP54496.1 hypothetical protein H9L05_22310 [Hymenobacter qilianensis]GGF81292.1 hypothetical protein GCM10011375_40330 [Hymenobacter qilianensis]
MEDHISPMSYEAFIRRAHGCERNQKGASCDYFRNLQNTESGQLKLRGLGTAEKQLAAVKGHLTKAIQAFLKPRRGRKLTSDEAAQLEGLQLSIERSYGSADLIPLVKRGLDITQPYKEA